MKIKDYASAQTPALADKLIGTSIAGAIPNATKNFTLQQVLDLFVANLILPPPDVLTEVTYAELQSKIGSSLLNPGTYYLITDFQTVYDQPDYESDGTPKTTVVTLEGGIEPLFVLAISENEIATNAYMLSAPNDIIHYDYTFTSTEVMGAPAKGRITRRTDENNNTTGYDHTVVLFKRYETSSGSGVFNQYKDNGNSFVERPTFGSGCSNMVLGNTSESNTFLLPNTVFGNNCIANTIGYNYNSNTIGDNFSSNTIGDNYKYNIIGANATNNYIQNNFNTNTIQSSFNNNNIKNNFELNTIGSNFQFNTIDFHFGENTITNGFANNFIGIDFFNNGIANNFTSNSIGNSFLNNSALGDDFKFNSIGNNFANNGPVGQNFQANTIGDDFSSNVNIGLFFRYNNIGVSFQINTIGMNFSNNTIGNLFKSNTVGNNFIANTIGYSFQLNTIGAIFQSNSIGNYFQNNSIGASFTENNIADVFSASIVLDYFRNNNVNSLSVINIDFSLANEVYQPYTKNISRNSSEVSILTYFDGSNALIATIPTA
jgi:hypothetical protein